MTSKLPIPKRKTETDPTLELLHKRLDFIEEQLDTKIQRLELLISEILKYNKK